MFIRLKKGFFRSIFTIFLCFLFLLFPLLAWADSSITVATWNVALRDRQVSDLDIEDFLEEVDFDILLVTEVMTQNDLNSLKSAMERNDFFTAISSFGSGNNDLEVGIISRFPMTDIVEFDRSLDNSGNAITEIRLERVELPGIADVGVGRGFLVAKVPELKLFVIATHLKSSRGASGNSDRTNAQKRELVAAAAAKEIVKLRQENPDFSILLGGDINVGVSDLNKNGSNLADDDNDGYDDTHAIFTEGLIDGLRMRSLAQNLDGTFVGDDNIPDFPGTGAIDVLYITGPLADQFNEAQRASSNFGSDHLAVFASTGDLPNGDDDDDENGNGNIVRPAPGSVEITNALPNPIGPDSGQETVTLTYTGSETSDISGWRLKDRANNTYIFPSGTKLNPGDNEIRLIRNTMPLNNSGGDTIVLLNPNGVQFGSKFQYSGSDVEEGIPVR